MSQPHIRIALRTKTTSGEVVASDLAQREIIFDQNTTSDPNTLIVKDAAQQTLYKFLPVNDSEYSSRNVTWSAYQINQMLALNGVWITGNRGGVDTYVESFIDTTTGLSSVDHTGFVYIADSTTTHLDQNHIYKLNALNDWSNITPERGYSCYNNDTSFNYMYDGDKWFKIAIGSTGGGVDYSFDGSHNVLLSLQGGNNNPLEYFHLSAYDYTWVTGGRITPTNVHKHDHSSLYNLQGGNQSTQYYHLNYSDYSWMTGGRTTPTSVHTHDHSSLYGLQGSSGGYHLSGYDYTWMTGGRTTPTNVHTHTNIRSIYLMASSLVPNNTNPCELPLIDLTSGEWYSEFAYLSSTPKYGYWMFPVPSDCSRILSTKLYYTMKNNPASATWGLSTQIISSGSALPSHPTTASLTFSNVSVSSISSGYFYVTDNPTFSATISSTSSDKLVKIFIKYSSATDSTAWLHGVKLEYY